MSMEFDPTIYTLVLVAGMGVGMEAGHALGRRWYQRHGSETPPGISAVDGALFALFGLLLAFTFSGAAARFEARRDLIRQEANDVGTAYLRLDLLPVGRQPELRTALRDYLDSRLATYDVSHGKAAQRAAAEKTESLQREIWSRAVAAAGEVPGPQGFTVLLPALNSMFDTATTRFVAQQNHPPFVIYAMMAILAWAVSLNAGFGMAGRTKRSWIHVVGFITVITMTSYVIVDLEFPRSGLIRIDQADEILAAVRGSMHR